MTTLDQKHIPFPFPESVLKPIEQATGLPNKAYVDRDFAIHERDQVLGTGWTGIGFAGDLPSAGYVKPVEFLGLPLIITRSKDDEIRVFHNVCSHRGRILVEKEGEVGGLIRCPYHSWTYDLAGSLRGTPHIGGVDQHKIDGFEHEKHGLKPVRSAVWMDVVFINLSGDAEAFSDYAAALTNRWEVYLGKSGLNRLRRAPNESELTVEVQCNWKLAVENYCESYHLPFIHPDLNRYSRLEDHYHIMVEDRFGGQGSLAYNLSDDSGVSLPLFPEWPQDRLREAEYVSFYPNVLLGIQADHAFVLIIEPISESHSIEHLRVYYVGDDALDEQFAACRKSVYDSWNIVFQEDVGAVEGMQKGANRQGMVVVCSPPVMDNPTHHFHQWVANRLALA